MKILSVEFFVIHGPVGITAPDGLVEISVLDGNVVMIV